MDDSQRKHDIILAEEAELVFSRFDKTDAWSLGNQMRQAALDAGLPVAIGIVIGRQRVFHSALDGASADNDAWLARKTAVVLRYGRSSMGVGEKFRAQGKDFDTASRLDPDEFAAHGGVFPLTVAGVGMVGAVGISGLPQADDHAFVVAQLREFLAAQK